MLWLLAKRWGQDDPHMRKAEKQLATNRLHCGCKISNKMAGRAAQQEFLCLWERCCPLPAPHLHLPRAGGVCPVPTARRAEEGIGVSPSPRDHAVPLHRQEGPTAHPVQSGLQAETAAICLTFPGCSSQSRVHRTPVCTIFRCTYGSNIYIHQALQDSSIQT